MQEDLKRGLKANLTRLLQDQPKGTLVSFVKASPSHGCSRTSFAANGFSGPLILLEHQIRIDLPTAVDASECVASSM